MIERGELIAKAAVWMQARGWKAKLAKKRGDEQSLFEHTLIERCKCCVQAAIEAKTAVQTSEARIVG